MGFPPAPWRLHGELIIVPTRWGGAMLANYAGGTLAYHELIVFRPGVKVAHIYVDSPESMRGGREIWKLPKELAEFTYSRSFVEVRQDGRTLFSARIRRRPGRVPALFPGPALGGKLSVGWITARLAPALVEAHGFGIDGTRLALAGDGMRLYMPQRQKAVRHYLRPLFDRVVVKELEPDRIRQSGLLVPPGSHEPPPQHGIVLAVGPGLDWWEHVGVQMPVKPGDHVVFPASAGAWVEVDEERLLVCRVGELLGVLESEAEAQAA